VSDLAGFRDRLGDVPVRDDAASLRLKSRDFFWFSPILREELGALEADLVVMPRDEADVLAVLSAAAATDMPLTPRGGGTGNYGQAMPLAGGAIVDLSALEGIRAVTPGRVRVGAGTKIMALDFELRLQHGAELRLHPSTARTATIGGYIAGGSGGIGSIQWGMLRDRGKQANHAYGTNGLILSVDMPTQNAIDWRESIVAFFGFESALRFGLALAASDGIAKKLASVVHPALAANFGPIRDSCPAGRWIVLTMVAESAHMAWQDLVRECGGEITLDRLAGEAPGEPPLYEYSWGHTTLHTIRKDRSVTYLQSMLPPGDTVARAVALEAATGAEMMHHYECVRFNGAVTAQGVPVFKWQDREQLDRLVRAHEELGIRIANPHTWLLQNGGMKRIDEAQIEFRRRHDPKGLMNPGKMAGWPTGPALKKLGGGADALETTGWI